MLYAIIIFSSFIFSQDFSLEDLNPTSSYYGEVVGLFPNTISVVYFGHYN